MYCIILYGFVQDDDCQGAAEDTHESGQVEVAVREIILYFFIFYNTVQGWLRS